MTQNVEDLLVRLDASVEPLRQGMAKAETAVARSQQQMTSKLDRIDRQFQQLNRSAGRFGRAVGTFGVAAGAAAAGGIAALATQSVKTAAEIESMARVAGTSVKGIQRLQEAGLEFRVEGDRITDGLRELNSRADEFAATAGGPAAEAFQRIGVNADEARRLVADTEAGFREVIQRVRELDSQAARTRVLEELFGDESAEQFLNFMDASQGEIRRLGKEAERAGRVLDEATVSAASKLEREFTKVGDAISKAFARGTVAAFGDEVDDISSTITDQDFQSALEQIGKNAGDAALDAKDLLGNLNQIANSDFAEFVRDHAPLQGLVQRVVGFATGDIGNITGSSEFERLNARIATLRELIGDLQDQGRPVPPQFLENLGAMQQQMTDLLDPTERAATLLGEVTVKAEPLPRLFTETGEAGRFLAKGLGETSESASGAGEKLQEMSRRAAAGKPSIDDLTKSSIDLSQSLELAELQAKAFRDLGVIEPGTGRIARDAADSVDDVSESLEDASDASARFEDEGTRAAAAIDGFGADLGRAVR